MLQKYMPLIFGFIYINVAAILNVYFIVSSAIRILTQEVLFRRGMVGGPPAPPTLDATATETKKTKPPVADRTERALPKPRAGSGAGTAKSGATAKPGATTSTNGKSTNGKSKRPNTAAKAEIETAAVVKRESSTNGANGKANGANGKKTTTPNNGNGSRRGPAKPLGNGSNGSAGGGSTSGSTAPKEHPPLEGQA